MQAYGLPDGAVIGFQEEYYKDLLYQNYFYNGQACQSMFAVQSANDRTKGTCASFSDRDSTTCPVFGRFGQLY